MGCGKALAACKLFTILCVTGCAPSPPTYPVAILADAETGEFAPELSSSPGERPRRVPILTVEGQNRTIGLKIGSDGVLRDRVVDSAGRDPAAGSWLLRLPISVNYSTDRHGWYLVTERVRVVKSAVARSDTAPLVASVPVLIENRGGREQFEITGTPER